MSSDEWFNSLSPARQLIFEIGVIAIVLMIVQALFDFMPDDLR